MKERPIIFSGPMVQAILDGRKTETRRVIKKQPNFPGHVFSAALILDPWHDDAFEGTPAAGKGNKGPREWKWHVEDAYKNLVGAWDVKCPYGIPGDRLYVRESFCLAADNDEPSGESVIYRATSGKLPVKWRPSIHMPKKYARIWLEVLEVRAERLQAIDKRDKYGQHIEGGAWAEGFRTPNPTAAFMLYWQKLNAKRGYSWESNPWVWVVKFKKI